MFTRPFISTPNSLTVMLQNESGKMCSYTIQDDHPAYDRVKYIVTNTPSPDENLCDADLIELIKGDYLAISKSLQDMKGTGIPLVTVTDDDVFMNGNPIVPYIAKSILGFVRQDINIQPLLQFIERLYQNPSKTAIDELYTFMEVNNLPITSDGCFLAYKNVTDDFKDWHTGMFDNSVGCMVKMDRREVNDDRTQTCSKGLHFCSYEYTKVFYADVGHTVIVKIDPKDVVSIPIDYNGSKGRCCEYEVVGVFDRKTSPKLETLAVAAGEDIQGQYGYTDPTSLGKIDGYDLEDVYATQKTCFYTRTRSIARELKKQYGLSGAVIAVDTHVGDNTYRWAVCR